MAEFIDDEILEMAVAREVDANRFYEALAAQSKDPNTRNIFLELAAEELEHKAKLELEIMKTGRVVDVSKAPAGFNDDQYDYSQVDFDVEFKDILLMGVQKEEASFRLYVDLAGMTHDHDSKETLLALAEEEAGHKMRLQTIFDFLSRST